jgi:hypothetical protein
MVRPAGRALVRGRYEHAFAGEYQRNNKRTGQKNLRCFPLHLPHGHSGAGFCGTAVSCVVEDIVLPSRAHRVRAWGEFAIEVPHGKIEGEPPVELHAGDRITAADVQLNERHRDNPMLPWLRAEIDELPSQDGRTRLRLTFNRQLLGWHYSWMSTKHTSETLHVFRALVFLQTPGSDEMVYVGCLPSSPFRLYTRRKPGGGLRDEGETDRTNTAEEEEEEGGDDSAKEDEGEAGLRKQARQARGKKRAVPDTGEWLAPPRPAPAFVPGSAVASEHVSRQPLLLPDASSVGYRRFEEPSASESDQSGGFFNSVVNAVRGGFASVTGLLAQAPDELASVETLIVDRESEMQANRTLDRLLQTMLQAHDSVSRFSRRPPSSKKADTNALAFLDLSTDKPAERPVLLDGWDLTDGLAGFFDEEMDAVWGDVPAWHNMSGAAAAAAAAGAGTAISTGIGEGGDASAAAVVAAAPKDDDAAQPFDNMFAELAALTPAGAELVGHLRRMVPIVAEEVKTYHGFQDIVAHWSSPTRLEALKAQIATEQDYAAFEYTREHDDETFNGVDLSRNTENSIYAQVRDVHRRVMRRCLQHAGLAVETFVELMELAARERLILPDPRNPPNPRFAAVVSFGCHGNIDRFKAEDYGSHAGRFRDEAQQQRWGKDLLMFRRTYYRRLVLNRVVHDSRVERIAREVGTKGTAPIPAGWDISGRWEVVRDEEGLNPMAESMVRTFSVLAGVKAPGGFVRRMADELYSVLDITCSRDNVIVTGRRLMLSVPRFVIPLTGVPFRARLPFPVDHVSAPVPDPATVSVCSTADLFSSRAAHDFCGRSVRGSSRTGDSEPTSGRCLLRDHDRVRARDPRARRDPRRAAGG